MRSSTQCIQRHFQVANTVRFRGGHFTRPHVELNRWNDECGHVQRSVPCSAHGDKLLFSHAVMHMNVFSALFTHSGLPLGLPRRGWVVMADENLRFCRQGQHFMNRTVKRMRIATREVSPRRANIGHEQGVAHENGVLYSVSHIGWGMAGYQHGRSRYITNLKDFPIFKEVVKLPAIGCKA